MSSPHGKFSLQHPLVVDDGCGCKPSIFSLLLSSLSSSSSSSKQRFSKSLSSSSTTSNGAENHQGQSAKRIIKSKKTNGVAEESIAVVKESLNPYLDFYESMLEMIRENEMDGWDDLCNLLRRYLALNSSRHHRIILRAFANVRNDVFSPAAEVAGGSLVKGR